MDFRLIATCCVLLTLLSACAGGDAPEPTRHPSAVFPDRDIDQTQALPGLQAPVEVARDEYGIPHFYAASVTDLMLAQGYVIARDRFWEMDVFRRIARGELSTLVGIAPILHDVDVLFRSIMLSGNGEMVYDRMYAAMTGETKQLLNAYTQGVNLYLEHSATGAHGARFPPEYNEMLLGMLFQPSALDIPRWRPEDSLAIGRLQQWFLSGAQMEREILIGKLHDTLPPELLPFLIRYRPAATTATLEGWPGVSAGASSAPTQRLSPTGADTLSTLRTLRETFPLLFWGDHGSNNWVLSPEKTESGNVLLANDPHLIMTNPPLFYQAQFNTKILGEPGGWNAYGVVFPGIPLFMIAHTEKIAWGVTVLGYDVMDVYREEPARSGTAVKRGAAIVNVEHSQQRFCHGYSDDCIVRNIPYVPGHGPKLAGKDAFYTFRWTGAEPTQDFGAFLKLMTATDVKSAIKAVEVFEVGAQNFVFGDVEGNIGYFGPGAVPVRDSRCHQQPSRTLDGASGLCEWQGVLSLDKLPKAVNPAAGYLATANNDIVGTSFDNDPFSDETYYWYSRDMGFRMARLKTLLEEKQKYNKDDMERISADVTALDAAALVPYLVAAADQAPSEGIALSKLAAEAVSYLRNWNYKATTGLPEAFTDKSPSREDIDGSIAASLYYTWVRLLKDPLVADEFALAGETPPSESDGYEPMGTVRQALHALENPAAAVLWDNLYTQDVTETSTGVMLDVLEETVAWLDTRFDGAPMTQWQWGRLHYLRITDLYGFLGSNVRSLGPYPNDGGLGTLDAATPLFLFGDYIQIGGPVMRMVSELGPEGVRSWNSLPGGQVHDRESPYYENLLPYFMTNTSFEVPFELQAVDRHLDTVIRFTPQ